MPSFLLEFLAVIGTRPRSLYLLIATGLLSCVLLFIGNVQINNLEFQGPMAGLVEPVRELFRQHYGKAALSILVGGMWNAYKLFRKDRDKLLNS